MSRYLLCYRLVADGELWAVSNTADLAECVKHIETYPLEKQAFFVVEIKDPANFDFQTRMLGTRVNHLTPVFKGGDDPSAFMEPVKAAEEVKTQQVKKSTKQNAEAQRAASLAAKEAKLAEAGGEAAAESKTAKKPEKSEKKPAAKPTPAENKTNTAPTTTTEQKTSPVEDPQLTSTAAKFNGRFVVWAHDGPSDKLSPEERTRFCEDVDRALKLGVGVSQGCHDQYVTSCLALNRSVGLVAGAGPQSSLTKVDQGVLKFQPGPQARAEVSQAPNSEDEAFLKSVEHAIATGKGVTQAVHDKYVALCVTRGATVAHVTNPNVSSSSSASSRAAPSSASIPSTTTNTKNNNNNSSDNASGKKTVVTQASTKERNLSATTETKTVTMRTQSATPKVLDSESFDAFQARKATEAGGSGSVGQVQAKTSSQQARVQQLMDTLDKEITRQMSDFAESQRLTIANVRLALENSRLEGLLKK